MFELFSTKNPVVVRPQEDIIYFHGARNLDTFAEIAPEDFSHYNWDLVKEIPREGGWNLDAVVRASKTLDLAHSEGYVVCDAEFHRIKVKSPQYVFFSLMSWRDKDGLNKRRMLEVIRSNEGSEFLSYFPQWKNLYEHLKMRFDELIDQWTAISNQGAEIKDDKEFVKFAMNHKQHEKMLWGLRRGTIKSVRSYLHEVKIGVIEKLLPEGTFKLNSSWKLDRHWHK